MLLVWRSDSGINFSRGPTEAEFINEDITKVEQRTLELLLIAKLQAIVTTFASILQNHVSGSLLRPRDYEYN